MSDKTIRQVIEELAQRKVFRSVREDRKIPRYKQVVFQGLKIDPKDFIFMEVDPDENHTNLSTARTWWPPGLVSKSLDRGPPMDVRLMFKEVRLLMVMSSIEQVLVTMHASLEWNPDWADLIAD